MSPRPERIIQDIARVPIALEKIIEKEGGIVPGLADRNGHRKQRASRPRTYHPPRQDTTPRSFFEMGIHPDAESVARDLVENAKEQFKASRES